jgi:hypothetical protein
VPSSKRGDDKHKDQHLKTSELVQDLVLFLGDGIAPNIIRRTKGAVRLARSEGASEEAVITVDEGS